MNEIKSKEAPMTKTILKPQKNKDQNNEGKEEEKGNQDEEINQNCKEDYCNQLHIETKRFCGTCQVDRPPFASHCGSWNIWVTNFDHHWGVLNCCIGGRNLHHFVLLQFFIGIGAFYALYAIPMYYYEVYKELEEENQEYFYGYRYQFIGWWLLGFWTFCFTVSGALCWCWFGFLGYGMSTWILVEAMWNESTLVMNIYPFICTFGFSIFIGAFFMALRYFVLIMRGSNKKIEGENFISN